MKASVVLKTCISLGLLALLFSRVDFAQMWERLRALPPIFIVCALAYYAGCQWLSCVRWQLILRSGGHCPSMLLLLSSYFGGMFLNTFLPSSIGGDAYRVYRVAQVSRDGEAAFVSVFIERATGLMALLAIALMGLPPAFQVVGRWDIIALLVGCTALLMGAILAIASPSVLRYMEPWLHRFKLNALAARFAKIQILLRKFSQHRLILAQCMGLSFLLQLAIVYYYYWIAQQLQISISYLELLVFVPIITIGSLLPISLGGLGVKEGLAGYLFTRIGLSLEQALLLSVTIMVLGWILSLPGALVLLLDASPLKGATRQRDL